jgi:hypothetical protein
VIATVVPVVRHVLAPLEAAAKCHSLRKHDIDIGYIWNAFVLSLTVLHEVAATIEYFGALRDFARPLLTSVVKVHFVFLPVRFHLECDRLLNLLLETVCTEQEPLRLVAWLSELSYASIASGPDVV